MGKELEYNSIDDIDGELIRIYDGAKEKGFNVGEACFKQLPFFANISTIVNHKDQTTILKYSYLKSTNTPPYRSLQDTPADFVDAIMTIEEEINLINKSEQENANK